MSSFSSMIVVDADDLFKVHKLKPSQSWRHHFDNYLKTIPVYFAAVSATVDIHYTVVVIFYCFYVTLSHIVAISNK